MTEAPHIPVLLPEILDLMNKAWGGLDGRVIVDGTFGAGGYSAAFLAEGAEVIAFDRDESVAVHAERLRAAYPQRFRWVHRTYSTLSETLEGFAIAGVDAVVLDIGVSSMQIDQAERGFSFMRDGPLDMRMDQTCGRTAAEIVNEDAAEEIAHILWLYGEERKSRSIAAAIVRRRAERPFTQTLDLAEVIERALGGRRGAPVHPATRTFQGLRIAVNDELGELESALGQAPVCLNPDGILAIVSFHSLEDRMVKQTFKTLCGHQEGRSRHLPPITEQAPSAYTLLLPQGVVADALATLHNPRARSARLRAIQRLGDGSPTLNKASFPSSRTDIRNR